MITVRYHIASLCAMILMLGIGIMVGLVLGSRIEMHQADLTKAYLQKLHDMKQQSQDDSTQISEQNQVLQTVVPRFTRSMLLGKRIAILRTGDYSDAAQNATDALAQTGATVTTSITISNQIDFVSPKQRADILHSLTDNERAGTNDSDSGSIYRVLAQSLKLGTAKHQDLQDVVDKLSGYGYISYSGDFLQPVDLIVVVGGSSMESGDPDYAQQSDREKSILDSIMGGGLYSSNQVVGCEPFTVGTSSIPIFQQEGISSVDCIDQPLGALDLVFALNGDTGSYGMKQGARLLIPATLQNNSGGN